MLYEVITGAEFLTVEIEEDGSTDSGYSKVMSQAFIDAEMELFKEQAKDVDIIITTAQIPGREAPKLILDYHVDAMKPGSVIVDLAASTGLRRTAAAARCPRSRHEHGARLKRHH